jgi:hypothetical protein
MLVRSTATVPRREYDDRDCRKLMQVSEASSAERTVLSSNEGGVPASPGSSRRFDVVVLSLLAALPVLPYLLFALREGVPRFSIAGDFALLEQATRHVWKADAFLGPYSRFHWHHPGPLFFYLAAPFTAMFGTASTGLFVGTCAINASASATVVALLRVAATRMHAIVGLLVVLGWFAAFGNVAASPWNPLVIVLPLMAFFVGCACLAKGDVRGLVPAVLFGALAVSTHVAAGATVAVSALLAGACYVWRRRRGTLRSFEGRSLAIAGVIVLVAFVPPLFEQVSATPGNMSALLEFFVHHPVPPKVIGTAARNALLSLSWMPDRLFERALPVEGWIAHGMRWDEMPKHLSRTASAIAVVHVLSAMVAAVLVIRRKDATSGSLLGFGVLAQIIATFSLRAIVGDDLHYLVFWTTAGSSITWLGILAAFAAPVTLRATALTASRRARSIAWGAILVAMFGIAVVTTSFQRDWLARIGGLPGSYPGMKPTMSALHGALRQRLTADGATAVVHLDGAYDLAQAMVLELEKDGIDVRVGEDDRWIFTGARSGAGLERPFHVWFSQPLLPLPRSGCLERLVEVEGAAVFVSPTATRACPP